MLETFLLCYKIQRIKIQPYSHFLFIFIINIKKHVQLSPLKFMNF